jgi:hypothetical protein
LINLYQCVIYHVSCVLNCECLFKHSHCFVFTCICTDIYFRFYHTSCERLTRYFSYSIFCFTAINLICIQLDKYTSISFHWSFFYNNYLIKALYIGKQNRPYCSDKQRNFSIFTLFPKLNRESSQMHQHKRRSILLLLN